MHIVLAAGLTSEAVFE